MGFDSGESRVSSKDSLLKRQLDETLQKHIAVNGVPGVVFQAYRRDGSTLYSGTTGFRAQGDQQPMTDDTVFWLASCTKVLTAICALKAVDQGLITLDEDVIPYLPDLAAQQVRENFMTPNFKLVPRKKPVTLRQLLSMTAGTSYPQIEMLVRDAAIIPMGTEPFMPADKTGYVGPFDDQPGTKWAYSGAIDWAGALVEKVSGLKLGNYLLQHILKPCGVDEITFELTAELHSRLAGAHFRWPDGRVTSRGKIFSDDVKEHLGGVGSYGTAYAYAQVLLLLINGGKHPKTRNQVLSPSIVKQAFQGQLNQQQSDWLNNKPTAANGMQHILPGIPKQWGLGFMLLPEGTPYGRGNGTGTWAGFANTHWMADPEKGIVMVCFASIIPQEDAKLLIMKDECEKIIYDSLRQ